MKYKIILAIFVLSLFSCKSIHEKEPTVAIAKTGSLANEELVADITTELEKLLEISVTNSDTEILKQLMFKVQGKKGSRFWREIWTVKKLKDEGTFLITFQELSLEKTDFKIEQLGVGNQKTDD